MVTTKLELVKDEVERTDLFFSFAVAFRIWRLYASQKSSHAQSTDALHIAISVINSIGRRRNEMAQRGTRINETNDHYADEKRQRIRELKLRSFRSQAQQSVSSSVRDVAFPASPTKRLHYRVHHPI